MVCTFSLYLNKSANQGLLEAHLLSCRIVCLATGTRAPVGGCWGPGLLAFWVWVLRLGRMGWCPIIPVFLWPASHYWWKRRAGDAPLLPGSLIFCSILIVLCGLGIMVTWNVYLTRFSSFMCNLVEGGGDVAKLHFKQIRVASAADWGLDLICKFSDSKDVLPAANVIAGTWPKSSFSLNAFYCSFRMHRSKDLFPWEDTDIFTWNSIIHT